MFSLGGQEVKKVKCEVMTRFRKALQSVAAIMAGPVFLEWDCEGRRAITSRGWQPGFQWPSTDVKSGEQSEIASLSWPKVGLLSYLGYSVGSSGKSEAHRRTILAEAFQRKVLPNVDSPEYLAQWGRPCSTLRLQKMAESIAAFCRNAKRRHAVTLQTAIFQWEADLAWLKKEFYIGRFDRSFSWPNTR
jgi:hypothetical protein